LERIERDVFDQSSLCPSARDRAASKADPFDRVDGRQKGPAFSKRSDNGAGYRGTVVRHRRRLNCGQQRRSTILRRRASRIQIRHEARRVIATGFFTACIERKCFWIGANLVSNISEHGARRSLVCSQHSARVSHQT
jgi:hypothetical protein